MTAGTFLQLLKKTEAVPMVAKPQAGDRPYEPEKLGPYLTDSESDGEGRVVDVTEESWLDAATRQLTQGPAEDETSSEESLRLEDGPAEDPVQEDPAEERRRAEAEAAVRSDPSAAPPASLESPPAGWPSVFSSNKELKSFMGKRGLQGKRCRLTEEATEEQRRAVTAAGAELGADSFENAQAAAAALGWAVVTGYAVFGEGRGERGPWCAHPRAWLEKPSGTWVDLTPRAAGVRELALLESALAKRPEAVAEEADPITEVD